MGIKSFSKTGPTFRELRGKEKRRREEEKRME
jgi:hypothetical protein